MAPIHGRGAMGFLLLGLLALIVALAGVLSPSLPLVLVGLAAVAVSAAGYWLYWRVMQRKPLLHIYADRLEVLRGPQRGTLRFDDVTGVQWLQWARSLFPYSRGHRVLVLHSAVGEWQVGTEVAEHAKVQQAVIAALGRFRGVPDS